MPLSKKDQCIADILTVAKQTLDAAHDSLSLAPIPGLAIAASTLSVLIGLILVAEVNKGVHEDLAKHIQALVSIIEETAENAVWVVGTDDKTRTRLVNSPELKKRVATLKKDLDDLANEAKNLEKGLFRFVLSKKNSDTLSRIRTGIDDATRKFHMQGGITVEMLINGIRTDMEKIKCMQQQERAERERAEQERIRELDERALKDLPHVNAGYSSNSNPTKSGTLEGTRTALLEEIFEWSLRSHTDGDGSFIYVLGGGAGTGKSTIAYEVADRLKKAGTLGASFFFVHDASSFNTATYVLPTIAYQLGHNQKSLYPHIAKAAREYIQEGKQGEQLQMDLDNLLINPLKNVEASHHPITLVFDALDECTKAAQDEVIRLLSLFMERLPDIPFPVRVFVTTRPEMKIEAALNTEKLRQVSKQYRLHEVPRQIVDGDIKLFFDAKLTDLSCWGTIHSVRPDVIKDLTNLAAGLFIYADTVVKFLSNKPVLVVKILDYLLSNNVSDAAFSLKNLDRLYIAVLQNALDDDDFDNPDMMEYIQLVLGSLALLRDPVSTSCLKYLVDIPIDFIRYILGRLGSVILWPEDDDIEIRMLHASFQQFLVDRKRCTDFKFYIDPSVHHHRLASTCLEVMTVRHPLKRNICDLNDPTIMKSSIPGLHDTVKKCIKSSLRYSCVHWATHLSHCNNPGEDILDAVIEFTRTKLLVWVEVLSYMNRLEVAVPALLAVLSWCEVHIQGEDRNEIIQLIDDMHRLVLQCYAPINDCPEHLYISAFPLAPSCVLTTRYNDSASMPTCKKDSIKSAMPRDSAWGPCLYTIPIEARHCRAVLSPNGRLIASGSSNGEVCIWDASIGTSKRTLKGHTKSVRCVAWAPDGESLVSGSEDGTIRVWNAISGAQVHIQRAHSAECKVYAVTWSRDRTHLVTSTDPGGVQVWDIAIGEELKGSMSIPGVRTVLAISKDSDRAIDWIAGRKLRLWGIGCENGKILKELPVRFTLRAAVFLHGDSQVAFCGFDDAIHLWDLESGECTPKVTLESTVKENGKTYISGIAVSQNGETLASSTIDKIHFFNTKTWDSLGSFRGYFRYSASFSPDDHYLLVSYTTVRLLDSSSVLAPKSRIAPFTTSSLSSPIVNHDSTIYFVTISLDGSRVAAVSAEAVSVWSLRSASLSCIIRGHTYGTVAFSPDAQKIAVVGIDKTCIWDVATTKPVLFWSISTTSLVNDTIAWSNDGQWIAGRSRRGLGVFDAVTGKLTKYLTLGSEENFSDLEFSHDNTMLYIKCGSLETIFRWKEGEKLELERHMWTTEIGRRLRFHKDACIVREEDGKRLCWVEQGYPLSIARWGNYYAVGKHSGKLDILHIEESSVDTTEAP